VKLRVVIVDDERIARQRLRRMLTNEVDVEILAECADGAAALGAIDQDKPDLLLLDIQMPGMDGFDVLEKLGPRTLPLIVFVTAFDEHAIRAFESCALDYLLKPTSPARLHRTLARVREHLALLNATPPTHETSSSTSRRFSVRSGQRTSFIAPEQIDWIEANGNYAVLHVGNQNHFLRKTMSTLESELPASDFLRVSRSAIVHLNRVKEIQAAAGDRHFAVLIDGQRVLVTRSVRKIEAGLRSL
jgi:two-component system, LytTR family, response regulator